MQNSLTIRTYFRTFCNRFPICIFMLAASESSIKIQYACRILQYSYFKHLPPLFLYLPPPARTWPRMHGIFAHKLQRGLVAGFSCSLAAQKDAICVSCAVLDLNLDKPYAVIIRAQIFAELSLSRMCYCFWPSASFCTLKREYKILLNFIKYLVNRFNLN